MSIEAETAVEMLRERLPGFASRINPAHENIEIRGALPITDAVSLEHLPVVFRVPHADEFRYIETAEAVTREVAREAVEPFVTHLVEQIQRHAIAAVNLDPLIQLMLQRARHEASIEAYADGFAKGKEAGWHEGYNALAASLAPRRYDVE